MAIWPEASHRKRWPFYTFVPRMPFDMKVMYDCMTHLPKATFWPFACPSFYFQSEKPCKVTKAETTNGRLVVGASFLGVNRPIIV